MNARRSALAKEEVVGARLGDPRRTARLEKISSRLAAEPQKSLPKQAGSVAALEATYRFLNNKAVEPEAILAPHYEATRARAMAHGGPMLVVHDTTELDFGQREQLGELNGGVRKGFLAHVSLVVSADESRRPLGVAACETLFREVLKKDAPSAERPNEGDRWARAVDASTAQLDGLLRIHVMDREADAYDLMSHLADMGEDFVIRAGVNRVLDPETKASLREALERSVPIIGRGFSVGKRPKNPNPRHRTRHPERDEHTVKAEISATSVELHRPKQALGSKMLRLNVVHVRELERTSPSAVEWVLWTTLPIETAEEVIFVVDAYRGRWRIEELFKSLKTGCEFEKLQLESRRAIKNALAVYLPVAWLQLHLRAMSRDENAPATVVLSQGQLSCLRFAYEAQENKKLPDRLSAREAMLAVARLGGHLKNNGDPGWLTIGRGMHDILMVELGLIAAQSIAAQAKDPINL